MKIYAVAKGRKTGIFNSWDECEEQVKGLSGAKFKSFKLEKDANEFIKLYNEKEESIINETTNEQTPDKKRKIEHEQDYFQKKSKSYLHIYTDGACSKNGTKYAKAGIGVYFEGSEYKDVSERISGIQTNNRAELSAILKALQIVKYDENIIIYTDSEYAINGITGVNRIHKNTDLFASILEIRKKRTGDVTFVKVQGHSGNQDGNYIADALASKSLIV